METKTRVLSIAFLLLAAGCATPEQWAEEMARDINAYYGPVCEKLGYAPGSDQHRDCMVSMFNADKVRNTPGWYGGWGSVPPPRRR